MWPLLHENEDTDWSFGKSLVIGFEPRARGESNRLSYSVLTEILYSTLRKSLSLPAEKKK